MITLETHGLIRALVNEVTEDIQEKINIARLEGIERLEDVAKKNIAELAERVRRIEIEIQKAQQESILAVKAEAEKELLYEKKKMADKVIESLLVRLEQIREDPRYPLAMIEYIIEGAEALDEEELELIVADADLAFMTPDFLSKVEEQIYQRLDKRATLSLAEDDPIGIKAGIVIRDKSSGMMYNNSIERRVDRLQSYILLYVDRLFESFFEIPMK